MLWPTAPLYIPSAYQLPHACSPMSHITTCMQASHVAHHHTHAVIPCHVYHTAAIACHVSPCTCSAMQCHAVPCYISPHACSHPMSHINPGMLQLLKQLFHSHNPSRLFLPQQDFFHSNNPSSLFSRHTCSHTHPTGIHTVPDCPAPSHFALPTHAYQ